MEQSKLLSVLRRIQADPSILKSKILQEVMPSALDAMEENSSPRELFKELGKKMTNRDLESSVELIRDQMVKSLVSTHLSKDVSFSECQVQMRAVARMSREMELELRGKNHPISSLTIKQMIAPVIYSQNEDDRFIDFLRTNKLITKAEINNIAKKVESYFALSVKPIHLPALAEIGLSFPDIFQLQGDAIFKANPTYRLLNLCLKKSGLPDLSTAEGRDHYNAIEFNHAGNIKALFNKNVGFSDNTRLLLNVVAEYTRIWVETHQTEEQQEFNPDVSIVAFCVSTLIGSISAVVATIQPISLIAAINVAVSFPDKACNSATNALAKIISVQNNIAYKLYSLIHSYSEAEYTLQPTEAILGLDEYLIEFNEKRPKIETALVEALTSKDGSLSALKNSHLGGLIRNFTKHTADEDLYDLIDRALDTDNLSKETIRKIVEVKDQLDIWNNYLHQSGSFSISDDFTTTSEMILMMQSALSGLDESQIKIDKLVELKRLLDEAYHSNNFEDLSTYALKIKNFDIAEVVLGICVAIEPAIKELLDLSVLENGLLKFKKKHTKKEEKSSTNAQLQSQSHNKEIRELNKKLRGLVRDTERLSSANKELTDEVSSHKQTITDLQVKLKQSVCPQTISELEKKFLFGEKTSIKDAINLINGKFSHVIFADDIDEQLSNCMYHGSTKLLKFLYLLATDYFDAITSGTPDSVAKDILGKVYRANESPSVLSNHRLKQQRMFNVDGESRLMTKHLSIGTSRDLRNSCSIYFEIEEGKIVIGYIGEHLDNTLT